jgi:hypothetical protein
MHAALRELPRIFAINPAPPKDLILLIADHDPDVGPETLSVDDTLVVSLWIQNGKP